MSQLSHIGDGCSFLPIFDRYVCACYFHLLHYFLHLTDVVSLGTTPNWASLGLRSPRCSKNQFGQIPTSHPACGKRPLFRESLWLRQAMYSPHSLAGYSIDLLMEYDPAAAIESLRAMRTLMTTSRIGPRISKPMDSLRGDVSNHECAKGVPTKAHASTSLRRNSSSSSIFTIS